MPPRLKDIAAQLNLSAVTVSKVLRNYTDISPETCARVRAKVKELNYRPNLTARSLVTRRSYTIGMVLPHLRHTFFQEAYWAIYSEMAPRGYTVLIAVSLEDPETERREIEQMLARQVDGLIVASTQSFSQADGLREIPVPLVLLDRRLSELQSNFAGVDDHAVGMLATEHLIEQGCRSVAHLRGPNVSTALDRLQGYRDALAKNGRRFRQALVAGGRGDDTTGYKQMLRLLKGSPRPDGVFCYNDPMAAGAMRAVFDAGLRVPDDVAIVGAGNMHYSDLFRVPLSTVDQGSIETGTNAARLLLESIEGAKPLEPKTALTRPKLVIRDSSRRKPVQAPKRRTTARTA